MGIIGWIEMCVCFHFLIVLYIGVVIMAEVGRCIGLFFQSLVYLFSPESFRFFIFIARVFVCHLCDVAKQWLCASGPLSLLGASLTAESWWASGGARPLCSPTT